MGCKTSDGRCIKSPACCSEAHAALWRPEVQTGETINGILKKKKVTQKNIWKIRACVKRKKKSFFFFLQVDNLLGFPAKEVLLVFNFVSLYMFIKGSQINIKRCWEGCASCVL